MEEEDSINPIHCSNFRGTSSPEASGAPGLYLLQYSVPDLGIFDYPLDEPPAFHLLQEYFQFQHFLFGAAMMGEL